MHTIAQFFKISHMNVHAVKPNYTDHNNIFFIYNMIPSKKCTLKCHQIIFT